eukprot:TRINITY_DN74718_c0_g1_i1.p1 TRINITY_DN74718_c0_g1~~TRINITY_DN74718_c0_g1_i1.p1  ORF type:complete len:211 (+),score=26.75 TRINITY_DN74718_c0_g1_i1:3-635(+)
MLLRNPLRAPQLCDEPRPELHPQLELQLQLHQRWQTLTNSSNPLDPPRGHMYGGSKDRGSGRLVVVTPTTEEARPPPRRPLKPALLEKSGPLAAPMLRLPAAAAIFETTPSTLVKMREVEPPTAQRLGIRVAVSGGKGVQVVRAWEGEAAALAGVREGDLITEVNQQPVLGTDEFCVLVRESMQEHGGVVLGIHRPGCSKPLAMRVTSRA